MTTTVVIDAVRTPFGKRGGTYAETHPVDLLAGVIKAIVERTGIDPGDIDQVVGGCVEKTGDQGFNIVRTASMTAGLPATTPGVTVDAQCGSSQEAFSIGHALIAGGRAEAVLVCGVESMTRVSLGYTFFNGPGTPIPESYLATYGMPDQFASAEVLADRYAVTREDCDALAASSNARAAEAWSSGAFATQVVDGSGGVGDQCIRPTTSEDLAALDPLAAGARHTKATASKVADGASAVLLMSEPRSRQLGLEPMADVLDTVLVGVEPEVMLSGPIAVTPRLLERQGLKVDDIDHFEVNEAFASVVLAWQRACAAAPAKVNPHGGALAMGHPLGATGTGLITKAVHGLRHDDGELALVTMCCGGGLGTGALLRRRS